MAQDHFAENFERLLGLHRLKAEDASELLGVSKTTLSNWRNGHKTPSLESVAKLAEVFEVDPIRLVYAPSTQLLEELMNSQRFERVERRLSTQVLTEIDVARAKRKSKA